MVFGAVTVGAIATEGEMQLQSLPFTDVAPNAPYRSAVEHLFHNGIMTGTGATHFSPHSTLRRNMVATILHRLDGTPNVPFRPVFVDVPSGNDDWYKVPVTWAHDTGVVRGVNATHFAPNDQVTREQLAVMVHRYAVGNGLDVSVPATVQVPGASYWAVEAMRWAVFNGFLQSQNPGATATRAETAMFIYRFSASGTEPEPPIPPDQPATGFPQSEITLPNRRLTDAERNDWIAEYRAMGPFLFEQEVIRLTNVERARYGLAPVQAQETLMMAARFYAQTMVNLNADLAHNVGPYGGSFGTATAFRNALNCPVFASRANGAGGSRTPEGLVNGWMNSPLHRDNILAPNARYIGVGAHAGGRWGVYHYMLLGGEF